MGVTYPAFSTGSIISASEHNTNNADLAAMTRGLTTQNMAAAAGILSSQLADRFGTCIVSIPILDFTSGADLASPAMFNVPDTTADSGTELKRLYMALRSGKAGYLCAARVRAVATTQATTAWVKVWLTKNGTMLGGGGRNIDDTSVKSLSNASFMDSPICSLANGDYLGIGLGRSDTSGRPTARGLTLELTLKFEAGA